MQFGSSVLHAPAPRDRKLRQRPASAWIVASASVILSVRIKADPGIIPDSAGITSACVMPFTRATGMSSDRGCTRRLRGQ